MKWIVIIPILAFVTTCFYAAGKVGNEISNAKKVQQDKPAIPKVWQYQTKTDPLTGEGQQIATAVSINTVEFEFPYNGVQHAFLSIMREPDGTFGSMLYLNKAQFLCGVSGCSLSATFDDNDPRSFAAVEPKDRSSNVLFFDDGYDFAGPAMKAQKMKVQATFFQNGTQTFVFEPGPLAWP